MKHQNLQLACEGDLKSSPFAKKANHGSNRVLDVKRHGDVE